MFDEKVNNIIQRLYLQREHLVTKALIEKLGPVLSSREIRERCRLVQWPDGTEQLLIDGEPVLQFNISKEPKS